MRAIRQNLYFKIFYWACAAILWTYMSVTIIKLYKSWYITTAGVCVVTLLLILGRVLKTRGLVKSTGFMVIYFLYLLLTATWAEYPADTVLFVAIDSINVIIFALFYILSMNFAPFRIVDFFVCVVPPAIIIYFITYIIDPEASRFGGYVIAFLPSVLLFCTLRLIQSVSIQNITLVLACLLMLVLGMTRTPLLVAGIGLIMMFLMVAKSWRSQHKLFGALALISIIVMITIFSIQPLRTISIRAVSRIIPQDVFVGNQLIEAEPTDIGRWKVYSDAVSLYKDNWLFGIGYMNFMPWFGAMYGYYYENIGGKETVGMNLHNVYQTWALEGGLPCLMIVAFLLWKYFNILITRIRKSRDKLEKSYYKVLIIGMICLLVSGVFQQIHQTPVFYIFMGIVYALDDKYRNIKFQALSRIHR
jgi:O-antigen ligase